MNNIEKWDIGIYECPECYEENNYCYLDRYYMTDNGVIEISCRHCESIIEIKTEYNTTCNCGEENVYEDIEVHNDGFYSGYYCMKCGSNINQKIKILEVKTKWLL